MLIEAAGSALLVGFVAATCGVVMLHGGTPERARLLVAEGAVLALRMKTGAILPKTFDLPSWDRIATFAVLALRTALKRAFVEAAAIARGSVPPGSPTVSPAPSPPAAGRAG